MYIEQLAKVFESVLVENYPQYSFTEHVSSLTLEIENKKYDVQDQTLIETFLKEDLDNFRESFIESLNDLINSKEDFADYAISEEGRSSIIQLYIKSIEHMIDYYYNNIISKQFSST